MSPSSFTYVTDVDGDGWSTVEGDCDDYALGVHPFGDEDRVLPGDEDCNGLADSEDPACHPIGTPQSRMGRLGTMAWR